MVNFHQSLGKQQFFQTIWHTQSLVIMASLIACKKFKKLMSLFKTDAQATEI